MLQIPTQKIMAPQLAMSHHGKLCMISKRGCGNKIIESYLQFFKGKASACPCFHVVLESLAVHHRT